MTDNRLQPRLATRLRLTARVENTAAESLPAGKDLRCQTRDLSFAGMCIFCPDPLSPGTRLQLTVEINYPTVTYGHLANVIWCRQSDDGYLVGLNITRYLCDETDWKNAVIDCLVG